MKSATIFRRIVLTSQVLTPLIGSSAFCVGMRHHRGMGMMHTQTQSQSPTVTALAMSEDDYEFDFIAAATQAAVEREAQEPPRAEFQTYAGLQTRGFEAPPAVVTPTTTSQAASEEDCEFDFIAAATQAAVEREAREAAAREAAHNEFQVYGALRQASSEAEFRVYPALQKSGAARSQPLLRSE